MLAKNSNHTANGNNSKSNPSCNDDEQEDACRHCGSFSLHVDWAQGDRVCTHCGVVSEEKLLDDRPEWREFNDADDLAKGLPAAARSGLVPVDESRYLGGLQPTTLSKVPYGGSSGCSGGGSNNNGAKMAMLRKRLLSNNRKMDRMMGQRHARALRNARVSRLVQKRQLLSGEVTETEQSDLDSVVTAADDDIRPELEQILIHEEEDVHRMQAALNADKWSLRRAILLHGNHESLDDGQHATTSERDDLQQRLDSKLRKASADLYQAYRMLLDASRKLQLPDRVTHEATNMLCRYVARRDGFAVKGVSSRLAVKKNILSKVKQKQAAESLREHNKVKQMGSLCAALLLLTSRKLGWPRPLTAVCGCIQPISSLAAASSASQSPYADSTFIKPKHCSRAMEEIKSSFPDYARSIAVIPVTSSNYLNASSDPIATINFVDHAVRKLNLPPVAEASVRALVWHCQKEEQISGQSNGTKLSTLCAALAYFVCLSGSVMQRLASQAQTKEQHTNKRKSKFQFTAAPSGSSAAFKQKQLDDSALMGPPPPKKPKIALTADTPKKMAAADTAFSNGSKKATCKKNHADNIDNGGDDNDDSNENFDVFSHNVSSEMLELKQEYEMRRVWDAWAEQVNWLRSLSDVEQSSGVSSNTILSYYKSNIYPSRQALLEWLRDAVQNEKNAIDSEADSSKSCTIVEPTNILTETPLASVLLSHVIAAAPLLNPTGKQDNFKR